MIKQQQSISVYSCFYQEIQEVKDTDTLIFLFPLAYQSLVCESTGYTPSVLVTAKLPSDLLCGLEYDNERQEIDLLNYEEYLRLEKVHNLARNHLEVVL